MCSARSRSSVSVETGEARARVARTRAGGAVVTATLVMAAQECGAQDRPPRPCVMALVMPPSSTRSQVALAVRPA